LVGTFSARQPSLDRIDSNKGYIKDNIQFLSLIAQFAKNKFEEKDVIEFCKSVVDYQNSKIESWER
jgi:hypothetical protein